LIDPLRQSSETARLQLPAAIAAAPKAELHLHLEGSIQPSTVCALTARHGLRLTEADVRSRYAYRNFSEFIEAFKWVTSYVRDPQDFALITRDLAEYLLTQHVVYAEVTLSVGVMLLRKQQPEANFAAILRAAEPFVARGLRLKWIFDAARQFGAAEAMRVLEAARSCASQEIIAFGVGGDELSTPTSEFRSVYDAAADLGLHRLIHAGEIGGPEKIREAIEVLGCERIGHGIAAMHDSALMDLLTDRRIPLEVCPTSNLRTGALDTQLRRKDAPIREHPLPLLLRHGVPVVLSTDDPCMFHTTLENEHNVAYEMGLTETELRQLVANGHDFAFSPARR
jgi:adenosine deaminase